MATEYNLKRKKSVRSVPSLEEPIVHLLNQTATDTLQNISFLRLPDVKSVTGLSKTSLYTLIREKRFPAPVRLGPRSVAWIRSEIEKWAVDRVLASRSAA
ncbi:MAG TPA: AlpA family transcriptional regulator [Acidobacteriaceae bacterium]